MKKSLLLAGLLLTGTGSFAQQNIASEKPENLLPSLFPNWQNTRSSSLSDLDLYGPALSLSGTSPFDKASRFMAGPLAQLGLKATEWKLVRNTESPRYHYVSFTRQLEGREVVLDHLHFQFSKDGRLIRLGIAAAENQSREPFISAGMEQLKKGALAGPEAGETVSQVEIQPDWVWFPVAKGAKNILTEAYPFTATGISNDGQTPALYEGWVDARTGTLLYRHNKVKSELNLKVKGLVKTINNSSPIDTLAFPNLKVIEGTNTYYTDSAGMAIGTATTLPATVSLPLEGRWSKVRIGSSAGPVPTLNLTVNDTGVVYLRTDSQHYQNAYYHVTRIHDFVKAQYPNFTGMDVALPTIVDITSGSCNAFYNGSSINFYAETAACKSMAKFADIIYHEYGHGINDKFYAQNGARTMYNGALNEGYADIWAFLLTKYPVMGQGAVGNSVVRRYDTRSKAIPINISGEVHDDGEIIAGAWWDVAVNLGGADSMRPLFTEAMYAVNDGLAGNERALYKKILVSALLADDDDNNLNNGTPHFAGIIRAFAKHGIYLSAYTSAAHSELPHQPAGTPIEVNLPLTVPYPAVLQDVSLFYRARGNAAWDSLLLTAVMPGNYQAQIPAQAEGTVMDYYFRVRNALAPADVTYYPATYRPELASGQVTLPYQFGVGLQARLVQDFETDTVGWKVGNNTSDNATTGLWTWGVSTTTNQTGGGGSPIIIQPAGDRTSSTGKSLFTGNGSNVGNGLTSALSPYFDLSGYANPVIEYYRWFSNDRGLAGRNDLWQVRLANSAGTGAYIEQTLQSDYQWRRRIVRVHDYFPNGTSDVQLRFFLADNGSQNTLEGAVDDVVLYDLASAMGTTNIAAAAMQIYPNPANDELHVLPGAGFTEGSLLLYDLQGRLLHSQKLERNGSVVPTANLASGNYFLMLKTPGSQRLQKITISH